MNAALPYLLPTLWAGTVLFALWLGMRCGDGRVEVLRIPQVPAELARLAQAFGITEDVDPARSYGRMAADLFDEKDREIHTLRRARDDAADTIASLAEEAVEKGIIISNLREDCVGWEEAHDRMRQERDSALAETPAGFVHHSTKRESGHRDGVEYQRVTTVYRKVEPGMVLNAGTVYVRNETPEQAKARFRRVFGS